VSLAIRTLGICGFGIPLQQQLVFRQENQKSILKNVSRGALGWGLSQQMISISYARVFEEFTRSIQFSALLRGYSLASSNSFLQCQLIFGNQLNKNGFKPGSRQ